jgi:hypothetical protein
LGNKDQGRWIGARIYNTLALQYWNSYGCGRIIAIIPKTDVCHRNREIDHNCACRDAMLDGRIRYSNSRLGWAERNLLECWLFYCRCTRSTQIGDVSLDRARNHLRRAIKQYRRLNIAETRGIDTSVPGWRGRSGSAA